MNQEIRPGLTNIGQSPHNGERIPVKFAGANHGVNIFMAEDQTEVAKTTASVALKASVPTSPPEAKEGMLGIAEAFGKAVKDKEGMPPPPKKFHEAVEEKLTPEARETREEVVEAIERARLTREVTGFNQLGPEDLEERQPEEERQAAIDEILDNVQNQELRQRLEDWKRAESQRKFEDPEFLNEERKVIREAMLRPEVERRIPQGEAVQAIGLLDRAIAAAERKIAEERSEMQRGKPRSYFSPQRIKDILTNEAEREKIFEGLFARADATPGRDFHDAFSMYYDEPIYRAFLDVLREAGRNTEVTRYVAERELREVLHNANYVLTVNSTTENLVKYLQQFRSEMVDVAFSKKGVMTAFHMYEQALLTVMEEYGGYLPYEEVAWDPRSGIGTGKTERLARDYFMTALRKGHVRDAQGNVVEYEDMRDEEVNRALTLARGLGVATLRTLEIASLSKLPPGRFASLFAQGIIRDLNPFVHLLGKFNLGKDKLTFLGYLSKAKRLGWSQKELLVFAEKMSEDLMGVLEGKYGERPLGIINPARTGSMFSNTTWRVGERENPDDSPVASAIDHLSPEEKKWIGAGLRLEKAKTPADKKRIYRRIVHDQPLTLFLNMPEIQREIRGEVLRNTPQERQREAFRLVKDDMILLQEELFTRIQDKLRRGEAVPFFMEDGEGEKLNFDLLPEGERREMAKSFAETMQRHLGSESALDNLAARKFPFVLSLADAPLDKFQFIRTGGNGIARSLNDFGAESRAIVGTVKMDRKLPSYRKMEDIITDMRDGIYEEISQYDEDKAREYIAIVAEGFAKTYKKDWWARLPVWIGPAIEWLGARRLLPYRDAKGKWRRGLKASFAKTKFGNSALGWDEEDLWKYTLEIEAANMMTPEEIQELRRRIGATIWHYAWCKTRKGAPGLLGVLILSTITTFTKDMMK